MRSDFSFNWPASIGIPGLRAFLLLAVVAFAPGEMPTARAQDAISIKDPVEFNAYKNCSGQTDPKTKAACFEDFLQTYPQSVVKSAVLDLQIDTYQGLNNADLALSAASRQLQVDPNNMKAIFISVFIRKGQCAKSVDRRTEKSADPQSCDDAATLALRGLAATKPAGTSEDDWNRMSGATYPTYHSAIALDDIVSKRDFEAGISEYRTELTLYPADQTRSGPGLWDTLQLAEAYTKLGAKDADEKPLVQAVWFYARAWNFVPAKLKAPTETKMDYYYSKLHGNPDSLEEIKTLAAATVFPPEFFVISPTISTVGMPAHPRAHPVPIKAPSPIFSMPEAAALPQAMELTPETSKWPANEKPVEAAITWDSHGLYINASNSSLHQILKDVGTVTGATVEGLDSDERIFGVYGPGKARDVLSQLLHGTSYNVLMIGDQGEGTPRDIVLSSRHAGTGTTVATNPTPAGDDDSEADDQPPQQPAQPTRPGFGPGGQRTPQQLQEMQQRQQQMQRLGQGQPQPPVNPQ